MLYGVVLSISTFKVVYPQSIYCIKAGDNIQTQQRQTSDVGAMKNETLSGNG